jgi:MFS family permease
MIWLMASCQVDFFFLAHCQDRMMLRGKMSALYSSFGPAFGSLVVGWLVTLQWSFQSIYLFTLLLIPLSASISLGWC